MPSEMQPRGVPWRQAFVALVVCLSVYPLYLAVDGPYVLDADVVHLALSIERFDIAQHQPHPPGYLGYVVVLRLVHALTGLSPIATAKLTSRLFALLALFCVWGAARAAAAFGAAKESRLGDPESFVPDAVAFWALVLAATHPILFYYGVDGQTHSAEAAVAAALLWALAFPDVRPTTARAAGIGLLLAAGGSLRSTFVLVAAGPVLWRFWKAWRPLAWVVGVGALGTAAWLVPTVWLSGGWASYRAACDALIGNLVRLISVLHGPRDARYTTRNLIDVLLWSVVAGLPLVLCLRRADGRGNRALWLARWLLVTMAVPALGFYLLIFCAEAGYLAGLVPATVLVGILSWSQWSGQSRWSRLAPLPVALGQLGLFFLGPSHLPGNSMLPTVSEITDRQVRTQMLFDRIIGGIPPDEQVLVISDYGELTTLRQFPLYRPGADCLFLHSSRLTIFPMTTMSLARAHGWNGVPGKFLAGHGSETTLSSPAAYDWVIVDPRSSEELWMEMAVQIHCPTPRWVAGVSAPRLWVPDCFPDGKIALDRYELRFPVSAVAAHKDAPDADP